MENYKFEINGRQVVIKDSLWSVPKAKVYVIENGIETYVSNKTESYRLLRLARKIMWDQLEGIDPCHHIILFKDGTKSVDEYAVREKAKIFNWEVFFFEKFDKTDKLYAVDLGHHLYAEIGEGFDRNERVLKTAILLKTNQIQEHDIDLDWAWDLVDIFTEAYEFFDIPCEIYDEQQVQNFIRRKWKKR